MTAQPYNRFVFVSWSWSLPCNGNQVLAEATDCIQHFEIDMDEYLCTVQKRTLHRLLSEQKKLLWLSLSFFWKEEDEHC